MEISDDDTSREKKTKSRLAFLLDLSIIEALYQLFFSYALRCSPISRESPRGSGYDPRDEKIEQTLRQSPP
jgi:hypothetical protein